MRSATTCISTLSLVIVYSYLFWTSLLDTVISKFLKRHWKAKRRAPACPRGLSYCHLAYMHRICRLEISPTFAVLVNKRKKRRRRRPKFLTVETGREVGRRGQIRIGFVE